MIWINIAVGIVCFLLASRIAGPVFKDPGAQKGITQTGVVVCFAFLFALTKVTLIPYLERQYAPYAVDGELQKNPVFRALKKSEPATYGQILLKVKQGIAEGQAEKDAVDAVIRNDMPAFISKSLSRASNEATVKYMRSAAKATREMMKVQDDACYRLLFPDATSASIDMTRRLSLQTLAENHVALIEMIDSAFTATTAQPTAEEIEPALSPIRGVVAAKYGKDFDLLDKPQTELAQRRKVCDIVLDLNEGFLALPAAQSGPLFRHLATKRHGGSLVVK